jgi:hypothetical protein
MLPVAGVLAVMLAWPRARSRATDGRLAVEVFGLTLVAVAIIWAAWIALFGQPPAPDRMLPDGIHPNLAGPQAIARTLVERLTE